MKSNVNVFIGVVLCAVLCGTFVWLRSAGEEDTWKPNEIYDQVHSSSYSASYTNATFSGSPQDGGVALSMSSSSLSRKANFYAGAHSGVTTMPIASSPVSLLPSLQGGTGGSEGLYTTSSAELKSFGGGGNGGAAMGGSSRANSVSNPSLQGGAGVGFISSPISYTSARRSEVGGTSGTNPSMIAQQGMTPDMASASNFGYAAASNYLNAGTYDQYNAMYGGSSTGRSNVRGRQNALGFNDSWWKWFDTWVHSNSNGDGYYDETEGSEGYYFNRYSLQKAYDDFCKYFWNSGMGVPPSFDEWLDWYQSAMGENGYYAYSKSRYYWVPLGDILPLILLALLYLVVMYFRTKFRTRVND